MIDLLFAKNIQYLKKRLKYIVDIPLSSNIMCVCVGVCNSIYISFSNFILVTFSTKLQQIF